jgi:hypothetical protein
MRRVFADDPSIPGVTAATGTLRVFDRDRPPFLTRTLEEVRRWATKHFRGLCGAGILRATFNERVFRRKFETRLPAGQRCSSAGAVGSREANRACGRGASYPVDRSTTRRPAAHRLLFHQLKPLIRLQAQPVTNLMLEGGSTAAAVCGAWAGMIWK